MGKTKKSTSQIKIAIISFIVLVIIILFLFQKSSSNVPSKISQEDVCSSDAECVPSSCCHPTSCVTKNKAPICTGIRCTQVCSPGSLDCGQGSCGCLNKKCREVLKS